MINFDGELKLKAGENKEFSTIVFFMVGDEVVKINLIKSGAFPQHLIFSGRVTETKQLMNVTSIKVAFVPKENAEDIYSDLLKQYAPAFCGGGKSAQSVILLSSVITSAKRRYSQKITKADILMAMEKLGIKPTISANMITTEIKTDEMRDIFTYLESLGYKKRGVTKIVQERFAPFGGKYGRR